MKITYLKPHNGKEKGHKETVSPEAGNYLVRVGVAKEAKEKKDAENTKEEDLANAEILASVVPAKDAEVLIEEVKEKTGEDISEKVEVEPTEKKDAKPISKKHITKP